MIRTSDFNIAWHRAQDPEPELYDAVLAVLQTEFRRPDGTVYRPGGYSYRSLYAKTARGFVTHAVMKEPTPSGFDEVIQSGKWKFSFEWIALNPRWQFDNPVRERAWKRLDQERTPSGSSR